jgi:hypothetical protein
MGIIVAVRRLVDAFRFAAAVVIWLISRRPVRPRGDEARRELPAEELLPTAKGHWTNAITIGAKANEFIHTTKFEVGMSP